MTAAADARPGAARKTENEEIILRKIIILLALALALVAAVAIAAAAVEESSAAQVIAKCAEAMGGAAGIKAVRALRLEVVYPDHDATPVLQEIRLPNQFRTERPGEYVAVFDGSRGAMLKYDPAKPGQPPVPQDIPAGAERGFETDLVWFFPLFFEYPAEYAGVVESKGGKCHKLVVTLPLGTRAEYLVDAQTFMIKTIAVDETFQGKTYHMEREWLVLRPVQGIPYPSRMSYPGRGGKAAVAELKKVEFNPVISEDRFKVPAAVR